MSSDFTKLLVKDNRLDITDTVKYGVFKGGQNMTPAVFQAVSATTSNCTFNIQVPSEQTVIDRRVLWRSTVVLKISGVAPAGQYLIDYGNTDALSPFALHSLCSVMSLTINNNTTSINMRDVLPAILRFHDKRTLNRYNGYTPVQYDTIANYSDGIGTNFNPLGAWQNHTDSDIVSRGSWVLDDISTSPTFASGFAPTPSDGTTPQVVYVKFTVAEPLLISPLIFADPSSNLSGMHSIQNLNAVFNIGSASRVWRCAPFDGVAPTVIQKSCELMSFSNCELVFNFLTGHPSDLNQKWGQKACRNTMLVSF